MSNMDDVPPRGSVNTIPTAIDVVDATPPPPLPLPPASTWLMQFDHPLLFHQH